MEKGYKKLLGTLGQLVSDNKTLIQEEAARFRGGGLRYRNISVAPELQVVMLRSDKTHTSLNIGFPFPVYSERTELFKEAAGDSGEIRLFLRGKPLREFQRKELLMNLSQIGPVEVKEVQNIQEFRHLCKELSRKYGSFTYVDPYVFIGDSFINLHFVDNIKRNFGLELDVLYSNASEHLAFELRTKQYDSPSFSNKLVVIPDLIDNHWAKTVGTLVRSLKNDGTFFVIGRNLVVDRKDGVTSLYHLSQDEPLLRNKNIEDYMNDCLSPYVGYLFPPKFNRAIKGPLNLMINPFGLEDEKLIPMALVFDIIKYTKTKYPESNITVVKGLESRSSWISEFRLQLAEKRLEGTVTISAYDSLSEIAADIKKKKITVGITADTSLAHMFNFIGLRNLTFYSVQRWDSGSIQSLSSDSPLGFCRYTPLQFPIIFDGDKVPAAKVLMAVDYLHDIVTSDVRVPHKQKKNNTNWMKELFDQNLIVKSIKGQNGSEHLIETAKRISPIYKYGSLD